RSLAGGSLRRTLLEGFASLLQLPPVIFVGWLDFLGDSVAQCDQAVGGQGPDSHEFAQGEPTLTPRIVLEDLPRCAGVALRRFTKREASQERRRLALQHHLIGERPQQPSGTGPEHENSHQGDNHPKWDRRLSPKVRWLSHATQLLLSAV